MKIFIIGSPRSGTSITYYAMREVMGVPGPGESHVIPAFQRTVHTFAKYAQEFRETKVLANDLSVPRFREHVISFVRSFYSKMYPGGSFVDKTPGAEAISGAILIREIFPDSRIILTHRTGTEVVRSIQKKFGVFFDEACQIWDTCMRAETIMKKVVGDILILDQFDMTNSAQEVANQISEYLASPDSRSPLADFFLRRTTDKSSEHDWRLRLKPDDMNWTDLEKETFRRICGEQMTRFGFPM